MAASTPKCKCPKCGATLIVDAPTDHSTCVWCGASIPNDELAKESDIPPVPDEVQAERSRIDKVNLDESNTSEQIPETTATEKSAGPTGTTFSVKSLGKLILAIVLAPALALATFFVSSLFIAVLNKGSLGGCAVCVLVVLFCAIGVGAYPIWASVAPFIREQSLIRKVILGAMRALAIVIALLLVAYPFTSTLGPLNNSFTLPIRLTAFLAGLLIVVRLFGAVSAKKRIGRSIHYAFAMGAAGFIFGFITGGNLAPLGAVFIYGPLGFILGVIIGAVMPVRNELPTPANNSLEANGLPEK